MGIPREQARKYAASNFLFTGGTQNGPGDYTPETSMVLKQSPITHFLPESIKVDKAPNTVRNEQVEKFLGKRDDTLSTLERKHRFRSYIQNFEHTIKNKQNHMFISGSRRFNDSKGAIGPGSYEHIQEGDVGKKKDYSRPVRIFVSPTRNLDGALSLGDP